MWSARCVVSWISSGIRCESFIHMNAASLLCSYYVNNVCKHVNKHSFFYAIHPYGPSLTALIYTNTQTIFGTRVFVYITAPFRNRRHNSHIYQQKNCRRKSFHLNPFKRQRVGKAVGRTKSSTSPTTSIKTFSLIGCLLLFVLTDCL